VHKYGTQAQVQQPHVKAKQVNPHTIRHTSAMHLLRAGNDINMVSYWLGHADINTTHIYVEIDMQMKQEMIAKAGAVNIDNNTPWQQPKVLQWLNQLVEKPQLCGLNY
jgi:integrase